LLFHSEPWQDPPYPLDWQILVMAFGAVQIPESTPL
jgi:hypothetical protein